jgi:hypothetical protein
MYFNMRQASQLTPVFSAIAQPLANLRTAKSRPRSAVAFQSQRRGSRPRRLDLARAQNVPQPDPLNRVSL